MNARIHILVELIVVLRVRVLRVRVRVRVTVTVTVTVRIKATVRSSGREGDAICPASTALQCTISGGRNPIPILTPISLPVSSWEMIWLSWDS